MTNTTYLISGANRGLGRGLAEAFLSRPNSTVIAAVRDPTHPTSTSLSNAPKGPSSTLILVKLDAASPTDASTAIRELQTVHQITSLDVVIANAGIALKHLTVVELTAADFATHMAVNVMGAVHLFQAALPLLERSTQTPKFVGVSSSGASIGSMELRPFPNASYGPTKVVLNWLVRKIHFEHEGLVAFPVDPGWVQTDMGNVGAKAFGYEKAEITVEESVAGMVKLIDGATRESLGGKFVKYDGEIYAW